MRPLAVLGLAVALSGACLHAQSMPAPEGADRSPLARLQSYQQCDLPKHERQLLEALNHDVEGVVVCALREVAKIKLAQPECTSDPIVARVHELVHEGATPTISYKAYLTSIVLSNPRMFTSEGTTDFSSDEEFFTALARRLETFALRDGR